ncbi:hypothetical protein G7Y89_g7119 [Cudoniella acicularis]|uniref:Uncharacterized protein n=1 Tax=Cudoniella acicularis TaxID=354080 RepID=A0A8H4RMN2_9HELO|nr:hypothetical protein G7Y89_g7119 [Cudoniella acicularis]
MVVVVVVEFEYRGSLLTAILCYPAHDSLILDARLTSPFAASIRKTQSFQLSEDDLLDLERFTAANKLPAHPCHWKPRSFRRFDIMSPLRLPFPQILPLDTILPFDTYRADSYFVANAC